MPDSSWALWGDRHRVRAAGVVLVVAAVLLAGCSSGDPGGGDASTTPGSSSSSAPAAPEPTLSPSPTSTLSAAEQQAFEEATAVVLAYRQTITDLYSGARTDLNDLNDVATGELLDKGLMNIQQGLAQGWRYEPLGAPVTLEAALPIDLDLESEPNEVVVSACIDTTGITGISPAGDRTAGVREILTYSLVRTQHLPAPGWAVTRVSSDDDDPADRSC